MSETRRTREDRNMSEESMTEERLAEIKEKLKRGGFADVLDAAADLWDEVTRLRSAGDEAGRGRALSAALATVPVGSELSIYVGVSNGEPIYGVKGCEYWRANELCAALSSSGTTETSHG